MKNLNLLKGLLFLLIMSVGLVACNNDDENLPGGEAEYTTNYTYLTSTDLMSIYDINITYYDVTTKTEKTEKVNVEKWTYSVTTKAKPEKGYFTVVFNKKADAKIVDVNTYNVVNSVSYQVYSTKNNECQMYTKNNVLSVPGNKLEQLIDSWNNKTYGEK